MLKLIKNFFTTSPPTVETSDQHQARGNAFLAEGKHEEAAACYRQAISTRPDQFSSYVNLGYVLTELKRSDEANLALQQAIAIDAGNVDALFMLATLARDESRLNMAVSYYSQLLDHKPDFELAYGELCQALVDCGNNERAESVIREGLVRYPEVARFHYLLGNVLMQEKAYEAALACFDSALSLQPDYAELHFQRATALHALNRLDDAAAAYRHTIMLKPDYAEAHNNLGTALLGHRRHQDALGCYDAAIRLKPEFADAHYNESICRLQLGDFAMGWKKYEWRKKRFRAEKVKRSFMQPLWLGNASLSGKTILLHDEQGLGDTIQFCRYATLVSALGATVILLAPKSIVHLLSSLEGVARIITEGDLLPVFDFHCPLLSLPLAFGTTLLTVPAKVPYLAASAALVQRLHKEVKADRNFKVGICWKGNASYSMDADRSPGTAPFKKFVSRFAGTNVSFYSLMQVSKEVFVDIGCRDLGYELDRNSTPFAETAALTMNLDLIITCDTSIGHLAGALARPVWVVLPFFTDWRWIANQEGSPWYPNTRLFHQSRPGDWDELFDRVGSRLNAVLGGVSAVVWPLAAQSPLIDSTEQNHRAAVPT